MSAVFGLLGDIDNQTIQNNINKMAEVMRFRGPESEGTYVTAKFGFGCCAWNTVGVNKLPIFNEDHSIIGICDGEIYNWAELSESLINKGHKLHFGIDIEVIVHLYEEFGSDFPLKCNGQFCLVIWDTKKKRLVIARDHAGIKTVFYTMKQGIFSFASTIDGLLISDFVDSSISYKAIDSYFGNNCIPHPDTMYKEIFSLRPGHTLTIENATIHEHKFWNLEAVSENYLTSENEFIEIIRDLVIDSIKIRLVGNKSVGSVLSGGVDSSSIVSVLTKILPTPLDVFSIAFEEKQYDDSELQKIMLRQYELTSNTLIIKPLDLERLIANVIRHLDYPVNNASAMGTFRCFEHAKQKVEVIFDGEAADELFCGGGGIVGEKFVEQFTWLPFQLRKLIFGKIGNSLYVNDVGKIAGLKRFAHRLAMKDYDRILTWLPAFDRNARMDLLLEPFRSITIKNDEIWSGKYYLDQSNLKDTLNLYQYGACKTYLCNDLLYKNERMASANGIINRTPFADYRLIELAFSIPAKYKITGILSKNIEKKLIYRKALKGLVPDSILWRKKSRGFSQPIGFWMKTEIKSFVQAILLDELTRRRGIWNSKYVEQILKQHFTGAKNQEQLIWGLLTFELWMREHID